ncbi:MAG: acetolactate synthase small subunit [Erysipelotrichaceae bacterium]|jgi:acetolactate synthase-1/3 small subunit|nr:acetolactate synthase small subunit [Bacillota bacterium]NLP22396.1 acetolactate synthase small subunit [Erysipelotrichaceae bacterium]HCY06345.1 acetolactate synthase small subunit [Erysipelotrichaceae bacterium]
MEKREVISLIVKNYYGVLGRIVTLIGRRGYNIDTLTVSETNYKEISRITLTTKADTSNIDHIIAQIRKLEEVIDVFVMEPEKAVMRELLLMKIGMDANNLGKIKDFVDIYRASIVDLSPTSVVIQLAGKSSTIDGFITMAEEFEILEMCRTGITALSR